MLNTSRTTLEGIRLVLEKKNLPHDAVGNLDHWLSQGATLIINSVNQIDPVVGRFTTLLGRELNTHVNINSYTSCPSKQGFDIHYDKHDVFIVQITGRKAWAVFDPTHRWPLERETKPKGPPPESDPYLECELSKGDVLYIPRGHWHYAVAVTPSVHFTVGPESRTGIDCLLWLTQQLMENEEFFRRDFPLVNTKELGGDRTDDQFEKHLSDFRQRLHDVLDRESLKEGFLRHFMKANRTRRAFQLPHVWTLKDDITPSTRYVLPADQKVLVRYDPDTRGAVVLTRGHELHLHGISEPLLTGIFCSEGVFSGDTLLAANPDTTWEKLKPPLLALFDKGLLLLADPSA